MCVIACKPMGKDMPTDNMIENMWYNNPDGAGIMYNYGGKVQIEKGFMKLDDFKAALTRISETVDLKAAGVVMHFRITTHGGTRPENTHPFPISDSIPMLKKLRLSTRIGVAHNGIIHNTPRDKDISDTMEYIAAQLAPLSRFMPKFYENKDAMLLIKNGIESKMAFLTDDGNIYTVGDFKEKDGLLFSNSSYEDSYGTTRWGTFSHWDATTGKWTGYSDFYDAYPNYWSSKGTSTKALADADGFEDEEDVTTHYLMPISDVDGAFYTLEDGQMYEDDNYDVFIDALGDAWWLDSEVGIAYRDDTITGVYTKEGNHLRYDYKLAVQVDCYDYYGDAERSYK